jgi:16S rRNA (guanine966-N2)-methyltransferase
MRVIAGEAGGIPLNVPKTLTRPTTDRVREAIFSSLGYRVPGADVLDLYAGTGSLGIEALSRGANSVVFVDEYRPACEAIEANLKKTRLEGGTVRRGRVTPFLRSLNRPGRFDLIMADPPYARDESTADELADLLASESLAESLRDEGVFVLESLFGTSLPDSGPWMIDREKKYGETRVSYLVRKPGKHGLAGE